MTETNENMARLPGGSIDYRHYLDIGRRERQAAVRAFFHGLVERVPRCGSVLTIAGMAAAISLLVG